MEKRTVIIRADREAYSLADVYKTLTVGELISVLQMYDDDLPVYLSHDNGYTYGGLDLCDENVLI